MTSMGMKILNEDGSILYEFRDNLGAPLLYRILAVAKFTGEAEPEVILNPHVAGFFRAVSQAMPKLKSPSTGLPSRNDLLAQRAWARIVPVFRNAVLSGQLDWPKWTQSEKTAFASEELWAPYEVSDQFLSDFVDDEDHYFERVRKALER
jgi:hypothetical protein